jgi:hypothetical protein
VEKHAPGDGSRTFGASDHYALKLHTSALFTIAGYAFFK